MARRNRHRIIHSEIYEFVTNLPLESQIKYLEKINKQNNQRMRRLEKAGIKSHAYKQAKFELEKAGRNRFRETYRKGNFSKRFIANQLADSLWFNEAEGSTITGYKRGWQKRLQTLRSTRPYLDRFTDDELIAMFEAGIGSGVYADSATEIENLMSFDGFTTDDIIEGYKAEKEKEVDKDNVKIKDVDSWYNYAEIVRSNRTNNGRN